MTGIILILSGSFLFPFFKQLMVMEAMRISLLEHEERQRKEVEEKKKKEAELLAKGGKPADAGNGENVAGPSSSSVPGLPPIPTTSPIDVSESPSRNLRPVDTSTPEGRSSSRSPRPSGTPRSFGEASSDSRQVGSSALGSLVSTSLRISSAHSGSSGHSRSGSATPSFRVPTPRENDGAPSTSTLSAALAAHGTSAAGLSTGNGEGNGTRSANVPDPLTSASGKVPDSQGTPSQPPRPQADGVSMLTSDTPASARGPGVMRRVSSVFTGAEEDGAYDELPSEPDSPSHSPLLSATPVSEVVEQTLDVGGAAGSDTDVGARVTLPQ